MPKRDNYHFRDMPSVAYHEQEIPPMFSRFMDDEVLPLLGFTGYKLDQKAEVATHAVHNLIMAGLAGKVVGDTRRKDRPGVRLRVGVWDAIVDAGLARVCLGSEESNKRTRYRATGELLELRREWELRLLISLDLARNTERPHDPKPLALIYLHTGKIDPITGNLLPDGQKRQPIPFPSIVAEHAQPGPDGKADPRAIQNGLNYWRAMEDRIERINRSNLSHSWQAFATDPETGRQYVFQPNPCVRQIHAGKFFRAVRLYSWSQLSGQNLPKETRRTMLIDGEPVAELDYSGMATRMLYHRAHLDPDGDVYRPERVMPAYYGFGNATADRRAVVRDFVKRATNVCWNVDRRSAAHSAIGKLLAEHEEHEFLHKVVYQIENTGPAGIVDRIMATHPDLVDRFFTNCGVELMTTDGRIMLHILEAFANAGKPALGIHDSIVCRASDAEFAHEAMTEMYYKFLLYDPVINRVF